MNEIELVKEQGEEILWDGRPKFWPFAIVRFLIFLVILSILVFYVFIRLRSFPVLLPYFFLILAIAAPISFLIVRLAWRVTHYAITDKRIIFQSGIIGRDFSSLAQEA